MKVLLEFIVPFFSVPVKRTMDDASSMAKVSKDLVLIEIADAEFCRFGFFYRDL